DDPGSFLVDDRVDGDGRLAGAAVTDDQLALAPTDRDHRVDSLEPGLEGFFHRLPDDDSRRLRLDLSGHGRADVTESVDRPAERIHDAADECRPDWYLEHAARAANLVPFLELQVVAEDDSADVVFLEVERQGDDLFAGLRGGDLEHLTGDRLLEAVDACNPV